MSYRNSAGYADPTAGLALGRIRREEKRKQRQRNERKQASGAGAEDRRLDDRREAKHE